MQAISNTLGSFLTRTKESPAQTVLLVSALLAGGVGLAYSGLLPSYSGKSDDNLLPAITEEEAKKAMKSMLDQLHMTIPKLFRVADQIKQQFAQQGQQLDDSFLLRSFLLPNLESAFREIQDTVLNEYDMDEDDLEEAVLEYIKRGDRDLKETYDTIRNIFKKFGADLPEDDEEEDEEEVEQASATATEKKKKTSKKATKKDMTLEDTIRFFKAFRQMQHDKMEATIEEFIREFGRPSPSTSPVLLQRIMMESQRLVSFLFFSCTCSNRLFVCSFYFNRAQVELMKDYELDEKTLESALTKHQTSEKLISIIQAMEVSLLCSSLSLFSYAYRFTFLF
jgi:hypothetical protein